jgi:hypothetical protein
MEPFTMIVDISQNQTEEHKGIAPTSCFLSFKNRFLKNCFGIHKEFVLFAFWIHQHIFGLVVQPSRAED